jgi:uncharacterized protein (DUF486 family)
MRLFSRTVPLAPCAAVLACPAGMGARLAGAFPGGGAARRKEGAVLESGICYKFESFLCLFYKGWRPIFVKIEGQTSHSWGIALLEYCLAVPANRMGYGVFSGFQLKILQKVITLTIFMGLAVLFLKEKLAWNYLVAFGFLGGAAFFAFAFKAE